MLTTAPRPAFRRVASLLWFPFFFAAAFALMGLLAFASPEPHAIAIDAVGSAPQASALQEQLDGVAPDGFIVTAIASGADGMAAAAADATAAAYVPSDSGATLAVSSAASATRADYLHFVFSGILAASGGGTLTYADVAPRAAGDVSGVGIMFYALPLLLVGLITSIVLLQFGMWPIRKKLAAIAATGAFASAFAFLLATSLDVLPVDLALLVYGFVLTQTIGWLTTAAALLAKQFFMPVAMTFVLILGIPSSGATVNGDMLPGFIRWLNAVLPFAQFIDITRASAYFDGRGAGEPLSILLAWAAVGAALLAIARARSVSSARASAAGLDASDRTPADVLHRIHGRVRTASGAPVAHASVLVLSEDGDELGRTITSTDGTYAVDGLPAGVQHIVVAAAHTEPEIATISVHGTDSDPLRDFTLLDWDDAAGDPAGETSSRREMDAR